MESNATMFQLDTAIQTWKERHQANDAVSSEALSELESHLRDSIVTLEDSGLNEEEAFIIASKRLGSPIELEGEFGKVHQKQVWLSRTLLMLSGYLLITLFLKFIAFDQATASTLALAFGLESTQISIPLVGHGYRLHWSGIIHAVVGLLGLGIAAAIILSFARGTWQDTARLMAGRMGIGKLLTLWIVIYGIVSGFQLGLKHLQFRIQSPTLGEVANYAVSASLSNFSTQVFAAVMIVVLTAMLGRRYTQSST